MSSNIKSVSELEKVVVLDQLYSRQEVASLVGCIWANVLDASRGKNKKLFGELKKEGKVSTWMFTGQQVLDWRRKVESRTAGPKFTISFETQKELDAFVTEARKLFKDSKYNNLF